MSNSPSIHDLLDGYAAGTLTWEELLLVDGHVEACDVCRTRLARLLQSQAEMTLDSPPPSDVWPKILIAIDR